MTVTNGNSEREQQPPKRTGKPLNHILSCHMTNAEMPMETSHDIIDDFINTWITNEPTAREVVEVLRKRWGWTVLIHELNDFEKS